MSRPAIDGIRVGAALIVSTLVVSGCQTALPPVADESLRAALDRAINQQVPKATGEGQGPQPLTRSTDEAVRALSARADELGKLGPQSASGGAALDLGPGLPGEEAAATAISLQEAISSAVRNNLDVQGVRLTQAISRAELAKAEAAFDFVLLAGANYNKVSNPQPGVNLGGAGFSDILTNEYRAATMNAGIQKPLISGGTFSVSAQQQYTSWTPPDQYSPNPNWETQLSLGLTQPLLRGFGSDVNLAQINIARNRSRVASLEVVRSLLALVAQVESAYWDVVVARQQVVSAEWLVRVGVEVRDILAKRREFDATLADYADAVATVEQRRSRLLQAQLAAKVASDTLKLAMNDPALPVGGEAVLVPTDWPVDAPLTCSLRDSVVTAVERNPAISQALIGIDSASIGLLVADNGRLPALDLNSSVSWAGLQGGLGPAWQDVVDSTFLNWLVGVQFSQPIGNRAAEAEYRAKRLERSQAAIRYAAAVEQAVYEVRVSLRQVATSYRLIEQARATHLAEAENLRALLVLERTLASLTPEFLFLKFQRQDRLAAAHQEVVRALTDYNSAIAELYRAMGTGLERNRIEVALPAADG